MQIKRIYCVLFILVFLLVNSALCTASADEIKPTFYLDYEYSDSDNTLVLKWENSVDGPYRLYKRSKNIYNFVTIVDENQYIIKNPERGMEYRYFVTNQDFTELSQDCIAYVPLKKVVPTLTQSKSGFLLKWDKQEYEDYYQIYSETKFGISVMHTVYETSFYDADVQPDTEYTYYIRSAYKNSDEDLKFSEYTKLLPVKYKKVSSTDSKAKSTTKAAAKPPIPKKPVIDSEIKVTCKSATLTWDKVKNAKGYQIYRKPAGGKYKKLKTITKLKYKDTALKPKKTYYYKIRAYSSNGKTRSYGKFSSVRKIKTSIKAPKVGYVTKKGKVHFTVKKVTDVSGYRIYRSNSRYGGYKRIYVHKTDKKFTCKIKQKKGSKKYYKIRAYLKIGNKTYFGDYSSVYAVKM